MKTTLVFLHGFLESAEMWDGFTVPFATDYNVICVDLPGHGSAPVIAENHTMSVIADYVVKELEHRSIERAIFVGHSMGGYVSLEIGKKYPDMVKGISMFFSSAAQDAPGKKKDRDRAARVVEKNHSIFIREAIPYLFTAENKIRLEKQIQKEVEIALQTPREGILACLRGMRDRENNVSFLDAAPFPIQYVVGKKDPVITMDSLDQQLSARSVKDVEIIDDCGHMGHLEDPEICTLALFRFFESIQN